MFGGLIFCMSSVVVVDPAGAQTSPVYACNTAKPQTHYFANGTYQADGFGSVSNQTINGILWARGETNTWSTYQSSSWCVHTNGFAVQSGQFQSYWNGGSLVGCAMHLSPVTTANASSSLAFCFDTQWNSVFGTHSNWVSGTKYSSPSALPGAAYFVGDLY